MKKNEAIKVLKFRRNHIEQDPNGRRIEEELKEQTALDMAIEALSTEPSKCEDCEHWNDTEDGCADRHGCDLISREDAINVIYNEFKSAYCWNCDNQDSDDCEYCHRKNIMWSASKKTVKSVINDLPSVSTERVGVWIDVNKDGSLWECNKCHEQVCCSGNNYCPNCGARMVSK